MIKTRVHVPFLLTTVLSCLSVGVPSGAQTLFVITESSPELRAVDPNNLATIAILGVVDHPTIELGRALALDPITGDLYATFPIQPDLDLPWAFGVLDFDASFSQVALLSDAIRDMTFDSTGKLWGVVGGNGTNANSLVSIDPTNGSISLENGALPTTGRNKIAYVEDSDTLYLLGDTSSAWELFSFSPASPTSLTQIPLSGIALDGSSPPPMVYDPNAEVLRTNDTDGDWYSISLAGLVSFEAPLPLFNPGGLAFDRPIFSDEFETGDTTAWSTSVGELQDCNCQFSSECPVGQFCSFGPGGPPIEDICAWTEPPPMGVVGAGCDQPYSGPFKAEICYGLCVPGP